MSSVQDVIRVAGALRVGILIDLDTKRVRQVAIDWLDRFPRSPLPNLTVAIT